MGKFIAYCKDHDWEGMSRDGKNESQLDLEAHIELFPSESHDKSGILEEAIVAEKALLEDDHKPGSTHAKCNRNGCTWHRGENSFTAGRDKVRVYVDARPDGVRVRHVDLKNKGGGRDYRFTGSEVTKLGGSSKLVEKGSYRIVPTYSYTDTGGPRKLTVFVRW